ncbi:hypothetical protein EDD86DRAFT_196400 [Gorgonomyces haynaldii]|nr:hypothetical protein EDD86DRAFT_196400 [Gorgonomyces haynaldii]
MIHWRDALLMLSAVVEKLSAIESRLVEQAVESDALLEQITQKKTKLLMKLPIRRRTASGSLEGGFQSGIPRPKTSMELHSPTSHRRSLSETKGRDLAVKGFERKMSHLASTAMTMDDKSEKSDSSSAITPSAASIGTPVKREPEEQPRKSVVKQVNAGEKSKFTMTPEQEAVALLTDPESPRALRWSRSILTFYCAYLIAFPITLDDEAWWSAALVLSALLYIVAMADMIMCSYTGRVVQQHVVREPHDVRKYLASTGLYIGTPILSFPVLLVADRAMVTEGVSPHTIRFLGLYNILGLLYLMYIQMDRFGLDLKTLKSVSPRATLGTLYGLVIIFGMAYVWHLVITLSSTDFLPDYIVGLFSTISITFQASWADPGRDYVLNGRRLPRIGVLFILRTLQAFFVGNIVRVMIGLDSSGRIYNDTLRELNEYLSHQSTPVKLSDRVRAYFKLKYPNGKYFREDKIFQELSEPLQKAIALRDCEHLLVNTPFFKGMDGHFLAVLALEMRTEVFLAGDKVFDEGTTGNIMYFVIDGEFEIWVEGISKTKITKGSYFGENAIQVGQVRRAATVYASQNSRTYSLKRRTVEKAMIRYPEVAEKLCKRDTRSRFKPPPELEKDIVMQSSGSQVDLNTPLSPIVIGVPMNALSPQTQHS